METLQLIAACDQLAAAFAQLRSLIASLLELPTISQVQRARIAKAYRDIESVVTPIDELLAFARSEER